LAITPSGEWKPDGPAVCVLSFRQPRSRIWGWRFIGCLRRSAPLGIPDGFKSGGVVQGFLRDRFDTGAVKPDGNGVGLNAQDGCHFRYCETFHVSFIGKKKKKLKKRDNFITFYLTRF
jgi:hypothetical protein